MSLPLPSVLQCFCMFVTVLLQNGCSGLLLFQNGLLCVFLSLNVYHPKKKSTFGLSFKNILKTIVQHGKSRKQQRSTPDRIEGRSGQGTYANLAIITHSSSEFILDFIRVMPGMPKAGVQSRIVLAPEHAKRLLRALEENIGKYERAFGLIRMPDEQTFPPLPNIKGEA